MQGLTKTHNCQPDVCCEFPILFETFQFYLKRECENVKGTFQFYLKRAIESCGQNKNCEISEAHQRALRLSSSQCFQTLKSDFICATCSAVGLWAFGRRSVFPLASRSSVFRSICFKVGVSFFRSAAFRTTLNAFTMVSVL